MSDLPPIMSGCWKCGLRGHGFRDCPNRPTAVGKRCFLCGLPGYTKYECPRPSCQEIIRQDWLAAQALEEDQEEAHDVQEVNEPTPPGTPPSEPVSPVQEPTTRSQTALEDVLRSEMEAFLATRLCGLVPSQEIRLRIPAIEVVLGGPSQSPPIAPVGALIDFEDDVNTPPPAAAQAEAEMPPEPPIEVNQVMEDDDDVLDSQHSEWDDVLTLFE